MNRRSVITAAGLAAVIAVGYTGCAWRPACMAEEQIETI